MKLYSLSLLLLLAPLPSALAQTPSEVLAAANAPTQYGLAYTIVQLSGTSKLILMDGVTPNPKLKRYEENGRDKEFADQAAVLNFLAAQGWEITPYGGEGNRYFLKRRRP